jgi:hypothetical protein
MAKPAATKTTKKPAKKATKKAAPKAKVAAKTTKAKPKSAAKPKAAPIAAAVAAAPAAPAPTSKIDWAARLRSGEDGVQKWNNLTHATRMGINLRGADLRNADLALAELAWMDLRGADLTGALLNSMSLDFVKFDEHTKWPDGFVPGGRMEWKGKGPDPRRAKKAEEAPAKEPPKPTDFVGFYNRLKQVTDPAKLNKAASMLKADKFKLYAKVHDDHLVGVVKSQTNPDLVYACRLGSDGKYSCGTQNVRACGGLQGSPCKHLLVLIVGLSRAGELDATKAHEWTQSTRTKQPLFDKDSLTQTFLQYKGAEAGEVDWRPTETIPEDFYAL